MTLGLVHIATTYLDPYFSMRAASRDLGVLLAGSTRDIATANAEGLFNDNALPYRSILGDRPRGGAGDRSDVSANRGKRLMDPRQVRRP